MAKEMHLKVGDALGFDVQGMPFAAKVGSIRKVDWSRFEPNFFVVFPDGRAGGRADVQRDGHARAGRGGFGQGAGGHGQAISDGRRPST